MNQTEFLAWLKKSRVKWRLVDDQLLRCAKGRCPLSVWTGSRVMYETKAQERGMSRSLTLAIMDAADGCSEDSLLRRKMLSAVGLG